MTLIPWIVLAALLPNSGRAADAPAVSSTSTPSSKTGDVASRLLSEMPRWWKLGVEVRGRADNYFGLNGVPGYDESYYMHRLRLNSTFTIRPWLQIVTQAQDSRAADYDRRPAPGSVVDTAELRQGYVELGVSGEQPWALRVGRQPLVFGDMRLVSTSNWSNVGPNYDGLRVTHTRPGMRLDAFASLVVVPGAGFDRPRRDKKLSGVYATFNRWQGRVTVDAYGFWKSNLQAVNEALRPGPLDVYTGGVRSAGKLGLGFDYNLEFAVQRGRIAGDRLAAWLGHGEIGHTYGTKTPRVWLEYNYASGDGQAGDGRRGTFEQLYPSPWNLVGRAADIASRNLQEPLAGTEWKLGRKWKVRGTVRGLWLANSQDCLYTVTGTIPGRPGGVRETRVGTEVGGWAVYQFTSRLQLWGGYAHLIAGPYLTGAGRGSIHYPYFLWNYTL